MTALLGTHHKLAQNGRQNIYCLVLVSNGICCIDIGSDIQGFYRSILKTRLGQLGANISPDRSSLTPQVLIGNFLKHNYPLLYELQHINLLCLYLPRKMVYPQTPNTYLKLYFQSSCNDNSKPIFKVFK